VLAVAVEGAAVGWWSLERMGLASAEIGRMTERLEGGRRSQKGDGTVRKLGKWGNSRCKDRRVDVMMRGAVENIVIGRVGRWLVEGG
jgi:hypothetical protein